MLETSWWFIHNFILNLHLTGWIMLYVYARSNIFRCAKKESEWYFILSHLISWSCIFINQIIILLALFLFYMGQWTKSLHSLLSSHSLSLLSSHSLSFLISATSSHYSWCILAPGWTIFFWVFTWVSLFSVLVLMVF
jgi:hypothetical protein